MKQFDTTILSFGLSQSQQHVIEQTISPIFQHIDCNNRIDDLFQIAAVCLIINADAMTSGQRKCLDIFYRDSQNATMIILTNPSKHVFHFEYLVPIT